MPQPTEAMREEAQRGLDWRREFGRGGTEVGIARARDIARGANLSDDTVKRMVSYFARHEVDKDAEGFRPGEDGYPSNGRIAWSLWGGNSGQSWANKEAAKMERNMELRPYPNEHAARIKDPDKYERFARENDAFGRGIDAIYGIVDNTSELQAIRFDKDLFTVDEARAWLADHDYEPIEFEPATERADMERQEPTTEIDEVAAEVAAELSEEVVAASQDEEVGETEVTVETEERRAVELVHRADSMDAQVVDERRVQMAISSEQPVERSFGAEVLDHSAESIDLSFLNSGRAPLLLDHDPTQQIGVIESVDLDGSARRLRATVRFGKGALANEVYGDVADGIRGNVSIGYAINKMTKDKDGRTYRAISWRPMEASIVSIPADTSVGVGRSLDAVINEAIEVEEPQIEITVEAERAEAALEKEIKMEEVKVPVEDQQVRQYDAPVQADIGMTKPEVKRYSLLRAINALANPTDRVAQRAAAFELECSEAAQRQYGQAARGVLVPNDILAQWNKRDLNTTDDAGMVAQNFRPGDFIDALRNASSVMQAGATMLNGLSGTVKIPKKSSASAGGWFTEGNAASESEMVTTSVTMSPKQVGAFTDVSRLMLAQTSLDIEALVRQDLTDSIALAIDLGALAGSGSSGQPTGIKNTSGINAPTNFAAANPTFAEVVAMETAVAEDNALRGNLAYILPASMYGALKTTTKDSGSGQFVVAPDGTINGYRAIVSNQVTAGDLYFGNFADLLIGMFNGGALDILVDPYSNSTTGTVRVVAMQSVDVAVRHAVSFAFNNDGV